jgi:hypothetical protein
MFESGSRIISPALWQAAVLHLARASLRYRCGMWMLQGARAQAATQAGIADKDFFSRMKVQPLSRHSCLCPHAPCPSIGFLVGSTGQPRAWYNQFSCKITCFTPATVPCGPPKAG